MSLDTKTENEELLNGAVRVETSDLDVCVGVAVPILSLSLVAPAVRTQTSTSTHMMAVPPPALFAYLDVPAAIYGVLPRPRIQGCLVF